MFWFYFISSYSVSNEEFFDNKNVFVLPCFFLLKRRPLIKSLMGEPLTDRRVIDPEHVSCVRGIFSLLKKREKREQGQEEKNRQCTWTATWKRFGFCKFSSCELLPTGPHSDMSTYWLMATQCVKPFNPLITQNNKTFNENF